MLLNETDRRKMADFVVKKAASHRGATEDGPGAYFRAVVGTKARWKGHLRGVYVADFASDWELVRAVEEHVLQTATAAWGADGVPADQRLYLRYQLAGENNPDAELELTVEDRIAAHPVLVDGAEQLRRAGTTGPHAFSGAAALALLETNSMLRGLVVDQLSHVRERDSQIYGMVQQVADLGGMLQVAQGALEVAREETHIRAVDRHWERLDPHLQRWGPDLVGAVRLFALGWAAQNGGAPVTPEGAAGPPTEPGEAADWHIDHVTRAVVGMGLHFHTHPDALTPEREATLSALLSQLIAQAEQWGKKSA